MIVLAVLGAIVPLGVLAIAALREQSVRHADEIHRWSDLVHEERERVAQLVQQMQANAQGIVATPWLQYPPAPPEPKRILSDDTGLITYEDYGDEEFREVGV